MTGRLQKVPQVVVGVEIERVKELGLLWMNRRNKELREHPVQMAILEEAALQLKTFAEYAARTDKKDLVDILERELQKINELSEEKRKNARSRRSVKTNKSTLNHTRFRTALYKERRAETKIISNFRHPERSEGSWILFDWRVLKILPATSAGRRSAQNDIFII